MGRQVKNNGFKIAKIKNAIMQQVITIKIIYTIMFIKIHLFQCFINMKQRAVVLSLIQKVTLNDERLTCQDPECEMCKTDGPPLRR